MTLAPWFLIVHLAPGAQPATPQAQPPQPPATQQAKPSTPPAQKSFQLDPNDLPVSLERIQKALAHTPKLRFDSNDKPVFRVEVFGEKPTIEDILGPDFYKGPVKYGGMTHQEFLNMVTPKDVQGYAAFSNKEGATVAATSFLLQWALQKAIHRFQQAKADRDREAARREVLDALAELDKARARAGLPPK
jgi:hypothetical protein